MNSIKVCEYSRSRSFHDDLILQDQASGERSQDHWSSGCKRERAKKTFEGRIFEKNIEVVHNHKDVGTTFSVYTPGIYADGYIVFVFPFIYSLVS